MKEILFEKLTVKETIHIMGTGPGENDRISGKECEGPDAKTCNFPRTPALDCTTASPEKKTCDPPA